MREIKFRAFYKGDIKYVKKGEQDFMFHQALIDDELCFVMEKDRDINYPFQIPFLDNEWILMQFTGLKDVDGEVIYEGDIVRYYHNDKNQDVNGKVVWVEHGFHIKKDFDLCKTFVDLKNPLAENCKVIGNIYENPELVKKGDKE